MDRPEDYIEDFSEDPESGSEETAGRGKLDGIYWDPKNIANTGRKLRRQRREKLKKGPANQDPSVTPSAPLDFLKSYQICIAYCKKVGIRVPLFMRRYNAVYLEKRLAEKPRKPGRPQIYFLDDSKQNSFNQENVAMWPAVKLNAWRRREIDPSAFYFYFRNPGERLTHGALWTAAEHEAFLARLDEFRAKEWRPDAAWGLFSRALQGRVGAQCRDYYRVLLRSGVRSDPAYDREGAQSHVAEDSEFGHPPVTELRLFDDEETRNEARQIDNMVDKILPERTESPTKLQRRAVNREEAASASSEKNRARLTSITNEAINLVPDAGPAVVQISSEEESSGTPLPRKRALAVPKEEESNANGLDGEYWKIREGRDGKNRETSGQANRRNKLELFLALKQQARPAPALYSRPSLIGSTYEHDEADVLRSRQVSSPDAENSPPPSLLKSKRVRSGSNEHNKLREKRPALHGERANESSGSRSRSGFGASPRKAEAPRRFAQMDAFVARLPAHIRPPVALLGNKSGSISAAEAGAHKSDVYISGPEDIDDSEYEDELATEWSNPEIARVAARKEAKRGMGESASVFSDLTLARIGAPALVYPPGAAARAPEFSFLRQIPLESHKWQLRPHTPMFTDALPAVPPTLDSLALLFQCLADPQLNPSPALSSIAKLLSADLVITPEYLRVRQALVTETEKLMKQLPELSDMDPGMSELHSERYKRGAELRLHALSWMELLGVEHLTTYVNRLLDDFFCLLGARPSAVSMHGNDSHPLFSLWTSMVRTANRCQIEWWSTLSGAWARHDGSVPGSGQTKKEEIDEFRWHTLFLSVGALGSQASAWTTMPLLQSPFASTYTLSPVFSSPSAATFSLSTYLSPNPLTTYRRILLLRLLALARYWHTECPIDCEVSLHLARFFALPASIQASSDARLPMHIRLGLPDSEGPVSLLPAHELYLSFVRLQVERAQTASRSNNDGAPVRPSQRLWQEVHKKKIWTPNGRYTLTASNAALSQDATNSMQLSVASAFLAQLIVLSPTLPDSDLLFLPARLAQFFPPPYPACEEDARATLFEALVLLARELSVRKIDLNARGAGSTKEQPMFLSAMIEHLRKLRDVMPRTQASLEALHRCLEMLLKHVKRREGRLSKPEFDLVDVTLPLLRPEPRAASVPNFAQQRAPPSSLVHGVQKLALKCVSLTLGAARADAPESQRLQREAAVKLLDTLNGALSAMAVGTATMETEAVIKELVDALARALEVQLRLGFMSPLRMLTMLESYTRVPTAHGRSLAATILLAVKTKLEEMGERKINLLIEGKRFELAQMWLALLFDPATHRAALQEQQSVVYRFTVDLVKSPCMLHAWMPAEARNDIVTKLATKMPEYDRTLPLFVGFVSGLAARLRESPVLHKETLNLFKPLAEWMFHIFRGLEKEELSKYFAFALHTVGHLWARLPAVLYSRDSTLAQQFLDRFVLGPVRGSVTELMLLTYLDLYLGGVAQLSFETDPYLQRVLAQGIFARCLSLALTQAAHQTQGTTQNTAKSAEKRMRVLGRAVWHLQGKGSAELRTWLARATAHVLAGCQPPLAFHLLHFVDAFLSDKYATNTVTRFRECTSLAETLAPSIASALSRAQPNMENALQFRRAVCRLQNTFFSIAGAFAPALDFDDNSTFLLLLHFTMSDAANVVSQLLGLGGFAPATALSIKLAQARTALLQALTARAPASPQNIGNQIVIAAQPLVVPPPHQVTLQQLQEVALREALNLLPCAGSATQQARAVSLVALDSVYELCTTLRFLTLPNLISRAMVTEEQRLVMLVPGGEVYRRENFEAPDVVSTDT